MSYPVRFTEEADRDPLEAAKWLASEVGVHLANRFVDTTSPHEQWMKQAARELTNFEDGFVSEKQYLIYGPRHEVLRIVSVDPEADRSEVGHSSAPKSEFEFSSGAIFLSLKSERLNRMIFFGEGSLRRAVREYLSHYHGERHH